MPTRDFGFVPRATTHMAQVLIEKHGERRQGLRRRWWGTEKCVGDPAAGFVHHGWRRRGSCTVRAGVSNHLYQAHGPDSVFVYPLSRSVEICDGVRSRACSTSFRATPWKRW